MDEIQSPFAEEEPGEPAYGENKPEAGGAEQVIVLELLQIVLCAALRQFRRIGLVEDRCASCQHIHDLYRDTVAGYLFQTEERRADEQGGLVDAEAAQVGQTGLNGIGRDGRKNLFGFLRFGVLHVLLEFAGKENAVHQRPANEG